MALYAFDGTWNRDDPTNVKDTNVVRFRDAYRAPRFYEKGVGTRFTIVGGIVGGISGAGGRSRVKRHLARLHRRLDAGDTTIDIVGFSRGAALALHFANQIAFQAEKTGTPLPIRFLGLWDAVPSFGVPGNTIDLGWDLDCPDNVERCCHAMALDERRKMFPLRRPGVRITNVRSTGRLFELWFRGVHSDIGGGNRKPPLSSITLNWMFAQAQACGLPIDPADIETNRARMNPTAPISTHWYDLIADPPRPVAWTDRAHHTVAYRADSGKRKHNNPPAGLPLVDDGGAIVGRFTRPAPA